MFSEKIESWRRDHFASLSAWCEQAKVGFDAIIEEVISSDNITDDDFVYLIKLIMKAGNFTQTEFSQITTIASGRIGSWLNGFDLPEPAVRQMVLNLCRHSLFSQKVSAPLIQMANVMDIKNPPQQEITCSDAEMYERLWKKVSELELSVRSDNSLKNDNIKYIGELVGKTESELLRTPNFGRKSLGEIKEVLGNLGLRLAMSNSVTDQFFKDLAEGKDGPTPVD